MQDLGQGNCIVMNYRAPDAGTGDSASTWFEVRMGKETCRELAIAFMGLVPVIIYFHPLQFGVAAKKQHLQTQYLFSYCYDNSWAPLPEMLINITRKNSLLYFNIDCHIMTTNQSQIKRNWCISPLHDMNRDIVCVILGEIFLSRL